MTAGGGVDVLARELLAAEFKREGWNSRAHLVLSHNENEVTSVVLRAISAALSKVAELIAADREYDEAWAALGESSATQEAFHVARIRYRTATARRASALAALGDGNAR